eukprot:scaffold226051_cov41-Prasinocladus_malaysianus.AAC.1
MCLLSWILKPAKLVSSLPASKKKISALLAYHIGISHYALFAQYVSNVSAGLGTGSLLTSDRNCRGFGFAWLERNLPDWECFSDDVICRAKATHQSVAAGRVHRLRFGMSCARVRPNCLRAESSQPICLPQTQKRDFFPVRKPPMSILSAMLSHPLAARVRWAKQQLSAQLAKTASKTGLTALVVLQYEKTAGGSKGAEPSTNAEYSQREQREWQ